MPDQRRADPDGRRKGRTAGQAAGLLGDARTVRRLAAATGSRGRLEPSGAAVLLRRVLDEALSGHADPAEALRALWEWLADPAHHNVERFFFEGYARSLHDTEGPWREFGADSVREWLPRLERATAGTANATFVLAALRGLLLDLLATGDTARVQAAAAELLVAR